MGYYVPIYRYGENRFLSNCKKKFKVDGIIVVDLPWPENKKLAKKAKVKIFVLSSLFLQRLQDHE